MKDEKKIVMQDMVNNGGYNFIFDTALPTFGFKTKNDAKGKIEGKRKEFFKADLLRVPCKERGEI